MTTKSLKMASVAAVFSVLLFAVLPAAHAETCVTDTLEVSPVEVCLDWDELDDPEAGQDFDVDFTTDPDQPNVELIAGAVWRLWALDPAGPLGVGDLGDIEAFGAEDYRVYILQPDHLTPGAHHVKSVVLTPQSGHYSQILIDFDPGSGLSIPSRVSGDLAGNATVVKTSSNGGTIALDVLGDFAGHLDAPETAAFLLGGNMTSTAQITIDDFTFGELRLNYAVGLAGSVDGPITIGGFEGFIDNFSTILIEGDLNADLTLPFMRDKARLTILGDCGGQIIINENAIPSVEIGEESFITIGGELTSTGVIDLGTDEEGVGGSKLAGDLEVSGGGAGTIRGINGLPSTGSVTLGSEATDTFSGDLRILAGFVGILGSIEIENLSGDVTMTSGGLDILGDFTSTGTITITGTTGGVEINKDERDGANFDGSITFLQSFSAGSVIVYDTASGTDGNMIGTLTVNGASSALIDIQGDLSGTIDVTGDLDGSIVVGDILSGDIIARDNYAGSINITGDSSGDIRVANDMSAVATINVGGELSAAGRIFVDGECDGDIIISERTADLSQIRLRNFGSSGNIVVNDSGGDFDAEGDIYVGSVLVPPNPPPPDVTYDGSILLKKESGTSNGGGLLGRIKVVGCHATTDDLDICECGTSPSINVTIDQPTCANQVDWSCVSGCP